MQACSLATTIHTLGFATASSNLQLLPIELNAFGNVLVDWQTGYQTGTMAELHVIGQVLGASGFPGYSVFCKVRHACIARSMLPS